MTMTTGNPRRPEPPNSKPSNYLDTRAVALMLPIQEEVIPKVPGQGKEEDSKFLVNGVIKESINSGVEITITPILSVPESLESHGHDRGLVMQTPVNKCILIVKLVVILVLLYLFVCSLGFLSDSFRLIAGKAAGEALQREKLINNPIVGVMMGILVTVAVQSSSTSTSIVVSMVASGLFTVKTAIPIIMGANIGTSVTNTIVALTHMTNRQDFERAFGGAVLHDMFNLLTVSSLLILEQFTSYLELSTTKILNMMDLHSKVGGEIQVLSKITKPFTSLVIQLNKDVIVGWSINDPKYDKERLLKVWCNSSTVIEGQIEEHESSFNAEHANYGTGQKCKFLFNMFNFGDLTIGIILLIVSLSMLCGCLVCLVKVLSSLLKGKLAIAVQKAVNANIPYVPFLTGYLAIGIGAIMTILVQSSSVFTSAMTPLIAMGMISLERAYPLTLGSNLGTTTTAMLAALATEGPNLKPSIQLALCHFLFNLTGILLFYPIPYTRFPIRMAAALGRITARYRWFAIFYLIFMFILLPILVFTLSLLGPLAFYLVAGPIGFLLILTLGLHFLQNWCPSILPEILTDWSFLPLFARSLEPYDLLVDRIVTTFRIYCPFCCPGGVSGTTYIPGTLTGGMRPNSSQVCFVGGSRTPSPQTSSVFDNPAFIMGSKRVVNNTRV